MNRKAYQVAVATFRQRLEESERFHMGAGNVHETLNALAADLGRAGIDYAVIDGMALNAYGYNRETVDVDVLVRPEGLDRFHDEFSGRGYRPAFSGARKTFRNTRTNTKVEFITTGEYPGDGKPKPVAFPDPATVANEVEGTKFVNLETLVELKLASGMTQPARRRDLADVQDLIRPLDLDESFAGTLDSYVREMYMTLLDEVQSEDSFRENPVGKE
ncbi:MAG: hypothetical protein O7F76_09905 [Planctomycetota bacterium]|nr:hypothetical protein [Planctomycetota bacterium]